jgi:hypothetical protein
MLRLRRALALALPASLLVVFGVAVPAQAVPSVAVSCTVTGTAHFTPKMKLLSVDTSTTGTYTFDNGITPSLSLQFNCLLANASGAFDAETLAVTSAGSYDTRVCGTGSFDGDQTGITATSLGLPGSTNLTAVWPGKSLQYRIVLVGGQGVLFFRDPDNPVSRGGADIVGGGAVAMTPTTIYTDGVTCTDGMRLVGAFAGAM